MQIARILKPLTVPMRLVPDTVHSAMLARIANHLMRGQGLRHRLQSLEGKTVCIHVTDVPMVLQFSIRAGRLQRRRHGRWDARISGCLEDFWLLATRAEDPDTLFFNRRLNIEGDTETGLYIKNLLDGLDFDWPAHFKAVIGRRPPQPLVRMLSRVRTRLAGN